MPDALVVISNFPSQEAAQQAAHTLVKERLAACINIIPGVTSIYDWNDKIQNETEVTVLIKTRNERYAQLEQRLAEVHPYEVPEILALQVQNGLQSYLHWINECTKDEH